MLITTVLVFALVLTILVLVHELGHFIAAKKMGIKVEEFGLGLPPRIWGKKIGETIYSINWLPIGGFVKLFGEEGEVDGEKLSKKELEHAFYHKKIWQRAVVLCAGVFMNFVLAVAIISFIFTRGVMVPTDRVHIEEVLENSPAKTAGLQKGDIIKFIISKNADGNIVKDELKKSEDLSKITKNNLGNEITLLAERNSNEIEVKLTPRKEYPSDQGPLGIAISNFEEKSYPWYEAPFVGLKESVNLSVLLLQGIGTTLWKLISFQPVGKDVAGPVGIAQLTGEAVKFGNLAVLQLLGILSLNLAIVNILPFPALDGGRLLFVIIEAVSGKRIKTNYERWAHQIGMAILLFLIVLVTLNDLLKIFFK